MAQFNFEDYNRVVNQAQSGSNTSVKIGFFKLADKAEALVRINVATIDDLKFATVHAPVFGKKYEGLGSGFTPVSCLNEVGSYSDACPFCKAAAEGHPVVGKATKKVYVEMLVSYKDMATGTFQPAQPVIWERPAGFAKELASKINSYGSLKEIVFKVSRNGSGKDTRYVLDFIPLYNKPECVSTDLSAFNNFNIAKHSYWEKSAEELNNYLATGSFPVAESAEATNSASVTPAPTAPVAPAVQPAPVQTPVTPVAPAAQPAPAAAPKNGFPYSF